MSRRRPRVGVMSALVIDFAKAAGARRSSAVRHNPQYVVPRHSALTHDFMFWTGASGARYVHTVYGLFQCPDVPNANVVLVRRNLSNGAVEALRVMTVEHDAPSSNLAQIRQTAAQLGANEIHVHLLAADAEQRRLVELDLQGSELLTGSRAAG
jgi:hypothetical protein